MKKKIVLITLAILVLLIAAALILAPNIARNSLVKNSKEWTGRQLALEKLHLNYFTGTLRAVNFKMFESDDTSTFVAFDTLILNIVPYKLISNELIIQQLYLKGLYAAVAMEDSHFNFDDLVAFYTALAADSLAAETVVADTIEEDGMRFEMSDFEMKGARLEYHDMDMKQLHALNDISFVIPYISWDVGAESEAGLKFNFKNQGFFQAGINIDAGKGDFDAGLEISLLQLDNFTDYAKQYLDIESLSGLFNADINFKGNINQPENLLVSGFLNISDFKSSDLNSKEFFSLEKLGCYVNEIDMQTMAFTFDSIVMEQPYLYVGMNETDISILNIMRYDEYFATDTLAPLVADTTPTEKDAGYSYTVKNIKIHKGIVDLDENMGAQTMPYKMSEIEAFIDEINSESQSLSDAANMTISLVFNEHSEINADLAAEINNGDFDGKFSIDKMQLHGFTPYLTDYANITSIDGSLDADIKISGNMYDPMTSRLSGFARFNDFYASDQNMWTFTSFEKVNLYMKNIDLAKSDFTFDSITVFKPYLYFEMYDSTNTIFDVMGYEASEDADTLAPSAQNIEPDNEDNYAYAIHRFRIDKGRLDFIDHTTSEPFAYPLSEIEMTADSITSEATWVNTWSQMLLNNRGLLKAQLGFDPSDPLEFKLEYVITDFLLSDLNIYSRHYMGFPILYGDMYYKSKTSIKKGQLSSENKLIIHNVELGSKTGGLYELPLKFALFLLKDRDGVINLDLPVRGDLNDPRVRVGKIIWTTFKNLIIKVAASPVNFLSGLLQVDPKDIKEIEFDYLDTTFTAYRQKQLDLLLELEDKKPGLEIEMVYFNDIEIEKEHIAIAEASKAYALLSGDEAGENEEAFLQYLHGQAQDDSLSVLQASLRVIPGTTLDSIAEVLASKRKIMLEEYIRHANDSSQIKTYIPEAGAPKNMGSKPVFEIKYSLKQSEDPQ